MEAIASHAKPVATLESAVDLAFADLASLPDASLAENYHRAPLGDLVKSAPWLLGFNLLIACFFLWLGQGQLHTQTLLWWFAVVSATSLWGVVSAFVRRSDDQASLAVVRSRAVLYAVLVGGAWSVCPPLFLIDASAEFRIVLVAMTMGAAGLGAIALARLPWAALTYTSLITASLAASLLPLSAQSAMIVIAYGAALALVVVLSYRREYKYAGQLMESARQAEIIALLLREFEAEASDWIWETGPDGRLTYVSERMARVLRRSRERLIGATLLEAAGRARRAGTWRHVAEVMARHETLNEALLPVTVRGGTIWWQLIARPLFAADGRFRGYRGVGKDITVRRQHEIGVIKAKEAAERDSKTKSEFLAVMSHELRTPLNAIVGFSQILAEAKQGPHANPRYAEYAQSVHQSGCHLASLINDILDITRFERGSISLVEQELDVVELVEMSLKMCRQTVADHRVNLVQKHGFSELEVTGDLTRLRQIIINLVSNAVKFSPPESDVEVAVNRLADGRFAVSVTDRGIGIDAAKLEKIFEPFAQVDGGISRRAGGLGLGLAIARRLARLHGGDIVITSRPKFGTVASLVLPASRVIAAKPSASAPVQAA